MMLTDMVGFSAITQRDEELALRLLRDQDRLVLPIFREFQGRKVKSLGDGYLVEFSSALDAVRSAISVQEAVHARNARRGDDGFELRIGIHLGDVVHRDKDVFGDAVNIASRIQPLADPGGVSVSRQVYDQVSNKIDVRFISSGTPELKNISTPIEVYKLDLPSAHPVRSSLRQPEPRVAVLPLSNISGRATDEYFVDGMTEELIQTLSKIAGLRVIGRASVMRYKTSSETPADIAGELGAKAVVEGGVRKAGNRIRVTVRLLDAKSSDVLWSQDFDREFGDVFALQSEISRRIADSLEVEILGSERKVLERPITESPSAHATYLRGRYQLNLRTEESLRQALVCFGQALNDDPRFALAYAGISDAHSTLAWLEYVRPRSAFPRARKAALRALALDSTLAEAHTSLGFVRFLYDRSWVEAEREFRRAISLNPNYPTAHQFYSDLLKALGRLDEALVEVNRALELDPVSLGINTALGHVLYLSRRYDDAITQYKKSLDLNPNFAQAHLWFGRPYLEKGMFDRAIDEVQKAVQLTKESTMSIAVLGHVFASAGRPKEAHQILSTLTERGRSRYVPSYWIALVYVGLGDKDRAFRWLRRAEEERSAWLAWVKVEPRFDRLRSDPRFARLLRRLKLT
jgi:TolB-like protein/class 3 adenylate cyclase/tetratricopeptide (TPR) repeat protein